MDTVLALLVYKTTSLLAGTVICAMGYHLFLIGIFKSGGDVDASFKDVKLVLRKAAPGTVFLVFGALVCLSAIGMGFSVASDKTATASPKQTTSAFGAMSGISPGQQKYIAQAVNTLKQKTNFAPGSPEARALMILLEFRQTLAKQYLEKGDFDIHSRSDGDDDLENLSEDDLNRVKRVDSWLKETIQ